ncbi:unnamed protein product, partial [Rangifer tarandus platyrhynchus]
SWSTPFACYPSLRSPFPGEICRLSLPAGQHRKGGRRGSPAQPTSQGVTSLSSLGQREVTHLPGFRSPRRAGRPHMVHTPGRAEVSGKPTESPLERNSPHLHICHDKGHLF